MSRVFEHLRSKHPIPEFDDAVTFYDYVIVDKITRRADFSVPIDHLTGALPAGTVLPLNTEVGNHLYFINGRPVRGSATGAIAKFVDKFDADANSRRMVGEDRILHEVGYKYYRHSFYDLVQQWPALRAQSANQHLLYETAEEHYAEIDSGAMASDKMAQVRYKEFRKLHDEVTRVYLVRAWEKNRDKAAVDGTDMHNTIQMYYENEYEPEAERFQTPEFAQFLEYQKNWVTKKMHLRILRTELSMFDPYSQLCGSCDALYVTHDTDLSGPGPYKVVLADWKRTVDISETSFKKNGAPQYCNEPFADWELCKTSERWIQLLMYAKMLEDNTGGRYRVVGAYIVAFHETMLEFSVQTVPPAELRNPARMRVVFDTLHEAKLAQLKEEKSQLIALTDALFAKHEYVMSRLLENGEEHTRVTCAFARLFDLNALIGEMEMARKDKSQHNAKKRK